MLELSWNQWKVNNELCVCDWDGANLGLAFRTGSSIEFNPAVIVYTVYCNVVPLTQQYLVRRCQLGTTTAAVEPVGILWEYVIREVNNSVLV